uniref:TRI18 n=1 Tax=Trichoderma albolutescens TaxID=692677 RepID=A0A5B8ZRE3_9HYPO|nr:TRI18 [Trichoderma albolutescens]
MAPITQEPVVVLSAHQLGAADISLPYDLPDNIPSYETENTFSVPAVPALDPSEFRWHPSPVNSSILQRKANGVENLVGIKDANAHGAYDFYNHLVLRIGDISRLTLSNIKSAFVRAMLDARFENPSIACYGVWGQNESAHQPHIQYKSFRSHNEARAWANASITIRATSLTGAELRAERNKRRAAAAPKSANSLDIIICANVASERAILSPGTEVEMVCFHNHLLWDGKARVFSTELLQRVSKILENNEENIVPQHPWGEEKARLDPPILDVLQVSLDNLGPDYETVQQKLLSSQLQVGSSWGLQVAKNQGESCELRYSFNLDDSKKITDAVRDRLGPGYNAGHLGHAALVLAILKHNPIPASEQSTACLYSPLPVDGRLYLQEDRKTQRYGNAQAGAVVDFPRLASWAINEKDPNGVKVALENLSKHIKQSYDYWLGQSDYLLPMGITYHNFISNLVASSDAIPDIYAPPFCNDGRTEKIIGYKILGPSGTKLFDVEDCYSAVHINGFNSLLRMETWKDAIRLVYLYNDGAFSEEQAQLFMADVTRYMIDFTA